VAYSRKKALELAAGEYVAILDADDIARQDRLQLQVAYLDSHPEVHLVGSTFEVVNENEEIEEVCRVPTEPLTIRWKLLFGNTIAHSSVMFRRHIALELGGYDNRVFCGEDFDLWVRFASHGSIAQIDQPMIQWRRHKRSLTYTEPMELKDHFVWCVVKSIRLQANLDVSFEVARCLFRDIPKRCNSDQVISAAYATIQGCLNHFLSQHPHETDRRTLLLLALEDIFRVARQSPSSQHLAWRAALQNIAALGCPAFFSRRFINVVLGAPPPSRLLGPYRTARHLAYAHGTRSRGTKKK
jgi:hypothetical protein